MAEIHIFHSLILNYTFSSINSSATWAIHCTCLKGWEGQLGKIHFVSLCRETHTALNNQKRPIDIERHT